MSAVNPVFKNVHPMILQEYAIYTPPIAEIFDVICEWIENKVPGGYIYGISRLGKSRAVKFWLSVLIEEQYKGRIVFFHVVFKQHKDHSEKRFLQMLLSASGNMFAKVGTAGDMLQRLLDHLITNAINLETNHIVLMVDEAQFLLDEDYACLCNIQNGLDDLGYRFTVIGVGSHELTYRNEVFSMAEGVHLLSRFMVRNYCFHGIRSAEELRYVLNGYDEQSEWPENSGVTFTQYFFPRAFKAGFRIAEIADDMWKVYVELADDFLKEKLNIPMEHIGKAVEYIFRKLNSPDALHISIDNKLLTKAIKQTAYEQHMHAVGMVIGRKSKGGC